MNIRKKLKDKAAQILLAPDGDTSIADTLQNLAIKALLKGRTLADGTTSQEWKNYMQQFTDDPNELKRMLGEDDSFKFEYQKQNIAYILSNSICGGATNTNTHRNVDERIDLDSPPPEL